MKATAGRGPAALRGAVGGLRVVGSKKRDHFMVSIGVVLVYLAGTVFWSDLSIMEKSPKNRREILWDERTNERRRRSTTGILRVWFILIWKLIIFNSFHISPNCTTPTLLLLLISDKPWFPWRKCYCCFEFRYICAGQGPILAKIWTKHGFHVENDDVVV